MKQKTETCKAEDILFTQGFGTRKECLQLLNHKQIHFRYSNSAEPEIQPEVGSQWPTQGLVIRSPDYELPFTPLLVLILNKPIGFECSHHPSHHLSVFQFIPKPYLQRGLQIAGRLDADAEGLLLLTDFGKLLHAVTSPRRHLEKTYELQLAKPLSDKAKISLESGLVLNDSENPTRPAKVQQKSGDNILITISEGRYHQVKRMLAAVGNRVLNLKRIAIGPIQLPSDLSPGQWRNLSEAEIDALQNSVLKTQPNFLRVNEKV